MLNMLFTVKLILYKNILSILTTMSYTLLIVESPAKCKKIESYLGSGYKCIASYGHIQELPGIKNIDIEDNFKPSFQPMESKTQQINKMRIIIRIKILGRFQKNEEQRRRRSNIIT